MQSKTKGKKGQVKEREQRKQKKLEKQRRKGKGTAHGPWPRCDFSGKESLSNSSLWEYTGINQ